jgi:hypothetical protein
MWLRVAVTSRSGGQHTVGESGVIPALPGVISLTHSVPCAQQTFVVLPSGPVSQQATWVEQHNS